MTAQRDAKISGIGSTGTPRVAAGNVPGRVSGLAETALFRMLGDLVATQSA